MCRLRKAKPGDESQVLQLVTDVLSGYGLSLSPETTDRDLLDLNKYYLENKGWFAVLEDKHKIVGSYGIYFLEDTTCELRKMYLLPSHQGRGLGKRMMEDAERKAKELGFKVMQLETNGLLDKAIKLYRKFGFKDYKPDHLSTRCNLAMKREL